ncbi:MAG: T9SS type A sorting domain-containing protein, partial [Lentimicrobiaceae bacterium]
IGNCPDVNDTTTFKNKAIDQTLLGKAMGITISNYPNPANQWTEFEYRMPDNNSLAEISIFDSKNAKIEQFIVKGSVGKMTYNTQNLNPGIYFYKFTTGSTILSGKFVVIH